LNLLEHDLSAIQVEVGESIFRALISDVEAQAGDLESEASLQIRDHQFWNQFVPLKHGVNSFSFGTLPGDTEG